MTFNKKVLAVGVLVSMFGLFALPRPSAAQNRGQYLPGSTGLNSGIMPSPGLSYTNIFIWFSSDTLKGPTGQTVPVQGSFNLYVDQNLFAYATKKKFLGARFMSVWDLVFANGSVTSPLFEQAGIKVGGAGLGDMYFQPVTLGWQLNRLDIMAGYGFVAPTGRYVPGSLTNVGSGYWGNMPFVAATLYLTKNKATQLSVYQIYEFHTNKRGSSITPGQTYTLEWGLGQLLPVSKDHTKLLQVGVVGYAQLQTSNDSGYPPQTPLLGSHYHVYAIGPQISFLLPRNRVSLLFRYEPEFSAQKRAQGNTMAFTASYTF